MRFVGTGILCKLKKVTTDFSVDHKFDRQIVFQCENEAVAVDSFAK